jgi:hypothetical protein
MHGQQMHAEYPCHFTGWVGLRHPLSPSGLTPAPNNRYSLVYRPEVSAVDLGIWRHIRYVVACCRRQFESTRQGAELTV